MNQPTGRGFSFCKQHGTLVCCIFATMKFKTGDTVKFLNSKGGGVVTRILGKDMVEVTIEDGFGIPVMEHEIIHTGAVQDPSANIFRGESRATPPKPVTEPTTTRSGMQQSIVPGSYEGRQLEPGLYLAFRPMDQRILTMGDLEVLLVNYTPLPLVVQLYLRNAGELHFKKQVSLPPKQSVILEQVPRTALESWLQGVIQLMAQPKSAVQLPLPVHASFSIKPMKFVRADGYENTNLDPRQLIPFLVKPATQLQPAPTSQKSQNPVPPSSTHPQPEPQSQSQPQPPPFIKRHITTTGEAEVDLHIQALTGDHKALTPMETLNFQLSYFRKALNSAIAEKTPKLIVIHGVGAGILKAEILKEVAEIDFAHLYDAPLHKYGVGATVIEFYHTKNNL